MPISKLIQKIQSNDPETTVVNLSNVTSPFSNDKKIDEFFTALNKNHMIVTLDLSNLQIQDLGKRIAELLKNNDYLREIILNNIHLSKDEFQNIAESLKTNKSIKFIDLTNSIKTDIQQTHQALQTAIQVNKNINQLLIDNPPSELKTQLEENLKIRNLLFSPDNSIDTIKTILTDNNLSIDTSDDIEGDTLLHKAVRNLQIDLVNYLLEQKANPDAKNKKGISPFAIAMQLLQSFSKKIKRAKNDEEKEDLNNKIDNVNKIIESFIQCDWKNWKKELSDLETSPNSEELKTEQKLEEQHLLKTLEEEIEKNQKILDDLKKQSNDPEKINLRELICLLRNATHTLMAQKRFLVTHKIDLEQRVKNLETLMQQLLQPKIEKIQITLLSEKNLYEHYRMIKLKIEEFFISVKALAGGFTQPTAGNLAKGADAVDIASGALEFIPGASVVSAIASTQMKSLDEKMQQEIATKISRIIDFSKIEKIAIQIAKKLTYCFSPQLKKLPPTFDNKKKSTSYSPSEVAAQCACILMIKAFKQAVKNDDNVKTKKVAKLMMKFITRRPYDHKKEAINKLQKSIHKIKSTQKFVILSIDSEKIIWRLKYIYIKFGIKVENKYYSNDGNPAIYDYCLGNMSMVKDRGFKEVTQIY